MLFQAEEVELGPDSLELVRKKGYSTLGPLPDVEYISGLHGLEEALREGSIRVQLAGETIVCFVKDEISEQDVPVP